MEIMTEFLKVYYNSTLGQIVAVYEDTGISVFEKTKNPYARGKELILIALEQTGNISLCSQVQNDQLFNEDGSAIAAPMQKPDPDSVLPNEKGTPE